MGLWCIRQRSDRNSQSVLPSLERKLHRRLHASCLRYCRLVPRAQVYRPVSKGFSNRVRTVLGYLMDIRDRFRGCLLGLAVGDAVGTTLEFKSPGSFTPINDMIGGGPFQLKAGEWTDDTSMTLCLATSLVKRTDSSQGTRWIDNLGGHHEAGRAHISPAELIYLRFWNFQISAIFWARNSLISR